MSSRPHQQARRFQDALAWWRAALSLAPRDFHILARIVQVQNVLGQHDAASASLASLRRLHATSTDPRVRRLEVVTIDRFAVRGWSVEALARLRPGDDRIAFQVTGGDGATVMSLELAAGSYPDLRRLAIAAVTARTAGS